MSRSTYNIKVDRIKKFGVIKELADSHTTLLDFDNPIPRNWYIKLLWVSRTIHAKPIYCRTDKTKHGYHIIVKWDREWSDYQILALQSILGSDYRREALNLFRLDNSPQTPAAKQRWNILYERKVC